MAGNFLLRVASDVESDDKRANGHIRRGELRLDRLGKEVGEGEPSPAIA